MKEKIKSILDKIGQKVKSILADPKQKKTYTISLTIVATLMITVSACVFYLTDYYEADDEAIELAIDGISTVAEYELRDGVTVFEPLSYSGQGFIFYPGGKVEAEAYTPLLYKLAERGVLCVLVEMPCNLAIFNPNAAESIINDIPIVYEWYIGGHSLGGSMAASYAASNPEHIAGIILLASYSTEDVRDIPVLSMFGSNDGVLNFAKYEQYLSNLPEFFNEEIILGGNHASFGYYGDQKGDGEATISREAQIDYTVYCITLFLGLN